MQPRHPLLAICAAALFGLAACGGGGSSAEKDITDAVKRAEVGKDVKARCEEVTTKGFVRRVYGSVAECRKAEKAEPDDKPPTGVRVTNVKVDGDQATATVREEGGDTDGAQGTFELRKEDGGWRIDDLGVDYLRSQVNKGLDSGGSATLAPKVSECARKALTDLSDAELKRVAYTSISERASSDGDLTRVIAPCLSEAGSGTGSGSASFLREKFEEGIASSLRKSGSSRATIGCINGRLRSSISEKEIQRTATNGGKTTPELTRKVADAIRACPGK